MEAAIVGLCSPAQQQLLITSKIMLVGRRIGIDVEGGGAADTARRALTVWAQRAGISVAITAEAPLRHLPCLVSACLLFGHSASLTNDEPADGCALRPRAKTKLISAVLCRSSLRYGANYQEASPAHSVSPIPSPRYPYHLPTTAVQ